MWVVGESGAWIRHILQAFHSTAFPNVVREIASGAELDDEIDVSVAALPKRTGGEYTGMLMKTRPVQ